MTDSWTREDRPFNYSATGYLGIKRPGMLDNHLLHRSYLGRGRRPHSGVPRNVVHGNSYRNPYTVADAMTSWAGGALLSPRYEQQTRIKLPTDFMQCNSGATSMGLTTAEEVTTYRKTRAHIPMIHRGPPCTRITRPPPVHLNPDTVYGKKTSRQQESIADLIAHVHQKQYLQDAKYFQVSLQQKIDYTKVKPNLTTQLRNIEINTKATKIVTPPRRLPKILRNIKPHLSTFRSENAHQCACGAHEKKVTQRAGNSICQNVKVERLPHYQRLFDIKDYHLCPDHGPCDCSLSTIEKGRTDGE